MLVADPSYKVRLQAVVTVVERGEIRAIPALRSALVDREPLVRAVAAAALGQLCTARGLGALEGRGVVEDHPLARRQAARAATRCRRLLGTSTRRLVRSGRLELAAAVVDRRGRRSRAGEKELE